MEFERDRVLVMAGEPYIAEEGELCEMEMEQSSLTIHFDFEEEGERMVVSNQRHNFRDSQMDSVEES